MNNCIIDGGYKLQCAGIGGVEKVWLGTYQDEVSYTMDTDNVVTGATTGNTVYLFEMDVEYGGLNQEGVFSRENGSVHYETVLSTKFVGLDADLRNKVLALGRAPLIAIIKSNAGLHYIAGVESAGRSTAGVISLGTAMDDLNGATMEITWKSKNGVYLMDGQILGTDIVVGN